MGDSKYGHITVIDTPGFGDPDGDFKNTVELVKVLKEAGTVDSFIWVWNSAIVRFNIHTRQILELFNNTFPGFWENLIIVANFWPKDKSTQKKRDKGKAMT